MTVGSFLICLLVGLILLIPSLSLVSVIVGRQFLDFITPLVKGLLHNANNNRFLWFYLGTLLAGLTILIYAFSHFQRMP